MILYAILIEWGRYNLKPDVFALRRSRVAADTLAAEMRVKCPSAKAVYVEECRLPDEEESATILTPEENAETSIELLEAIAEASCRTT